MASENLGKQITLPASGDLSTKQFRFVQVDSNGRAAPLAVAGADSAGVLQNKPGAIDRAATVMVGVGISKVAAGAVTTNGGPVASDNQGRAVNAASGDHILGEFMSAAGAADEIVSILFQKGAGTL